MNTALIISVVIIGGLAALVFITRARMKNVTSAGEHNNILSLTDNDFQSQVKDRIVLVDFWASWCAPCRMMAPVLNEVAGQLSEDAYVGKVDVEENQALARKFNVRSIPTLILFRNGSEVSRFVGVKSKEFLLQQINNVHK